MEEQVKNKKSKTVLIISIVVVLILLIVGGYFVLSKKDNKNEDKTTTENKDSNSNSNENEDTNTNSNENKNEQSEALDVNGKLVQDLYMGLKIFPCFDTYFYRNKNVISENMEIERKFKYAIQRLNAKDIKLIKDPAYVSMDDGTEYVMFEVSEDLMEKALKNALGEKAVLEKKSVSSKNDLIYSFVYRENGEKFYGNIDVVYNTSKKTFTVKMNDGGGYGCGEEITKIASAVKKGKTITITEKTIFVEIEDSNEYSVYSDIENTKKIGKVNATEYDATDDHQSLLDKYIDSAMTVVYTFEENEDGSYHFVSSKMTN